MNYEDAVSAKDGQLMYCDFVTSGVDPTIYEEVTSLEKLSDLMQVRRDRG
jgi:hypothetical protein